MTNKDLKAIDSIVSKRTDELAATVNTGFDAVDKRFNAVDKRFDDLTGRVDDLQENDEAILKHVRTIENSFAMPVHLRFQRPKKPLRQ